MNQNATLAQVESIETTSLGTIVRLKGKDADFRLPLDSDDYAYSIKLLERSAERKQPVGIKVRAASTTIEMVTRADSDLVLRIEDSRSSLSRTIGFQRHAGVYHLSKGHPDFERLNEQLEEAKSQKRDVWFLAEPLELMILDIYFEKNINEQTAARH